MAVDKLREAGELIKAHDYQKARDILTTVDHPKAREWLAKLQERELGDPFSEMAPHNPLALTPETAAARNKSYTNAAVIVLILYFVLWFPGVVANNMYINEAKRMQQLAGQKLPGVSALYTLRVIFAYIPLLMLILVAVALWLTYIGTLLHY